jgi:hypothetical protein
VTSKEITVNQPTTCRRLDAGGIALWVDYGAFGVASVEVVARLRAADQARALGYIDEARRLLDAARLHARVEFEIALLRRREGI